LENLGYLPKDFDGNFLNQFLNHANNQIRLLAVKNIAKLGKEEFLPELYKLFEK